MRNPHQIDIIRRRLLGWYKTEKREFLWRTTRDPYIILVSEIMLQQTQTTRVALMLPKFLRRFPSLEALSRARVASVIRAWQGMGYNNRAVRLRQLAREIMVRHHGEIPTDIPTLLELPGIGSYTAHAIACFAFRQPVAVVDVNVRRVVSRIFSTMASISMVLPDDIIEPLAQSVVGKKSYDLNQALMDLGSTICIARFPRCEECPVSRSCGSRASLFQSSPRRMPIRHRRTSTEPSHMGIPNRIWRGKIVATLGRLRTTESISVTRLGRSLTPNFDDTDRKWLLTIISGLQRDGLLSVIGRNGDISVMLSRA